jgi:hypothetical protein
MRACLPCPVAAAERVGTTTSLYGKEADDQGNSSEGYSDGAPFVEAHVASLVLEVSRAV